jgi:hypothetical protein
VFSTRWQSFTGHCRRGQAPDICRNESDRYRYNWDYNTHIRWMQLLQYILHGSQYLTVLAPAMLPAHPAKQVPQQSESRARNSSASYSCLPRGALYCACIRHCCNTRHMLALTYVPSPSHHHYACEHADGCHQQVLAICCCEEHPSTGAACGTKAAEARQKGMHQHCHKRPPNTLLQCTSIHACKDPAMRQE